MIPWRYNSLREARAVPGSQLDPNLRLPQQPQQGADMKTRDWDYIETRLLSGPGDSTEAIARMKALGHEDLAQRLMEAARSFMDECRDIRDILRDKDGRGV